MCPVMCGRLLHECPQECPQECSRESPGTGGNFQSAPEVRGPTVVVDDSDFRVRGPIVDISESHLKVEKSGKQVVFRPQGSGKVRGKTFRSRLQDRRVRGETFRCRMQDFRACGGRTRSALGSKRGLPPHGWRPSGDCSDPFFLAPPRGGEGGGKGRVLAVGTGGGIGHWGGPGGGGWVRFR